MTRPAAFALALAGSTVATQAQQHEAPPFGGVDDVAFAELLWEGMTERRLAGEDAIASFPYEGRDPHGAMLQTLYLEADVDGRTAPLIVKNNFKPVGATEVLGERDENLVAVTVMFRREKGYDTDNANWFWAKYLPDGSLDENPDGMKLAGRVAKGADQGCIACHSGAPGDDYLFTTNHID